MGLDSSIVFYVKKNSIGQALKWLYGNSWAYGKHQLTVYLDNESYTLKGEETDTGYTGFFAGKRDLNSIDCFRYSTCLVFDVDPKIIKAVSDWSLEFNGNMLPDFVEQFKTVYMGDGKIRMGGFDVSIVNYKTDGLFKLIFTAVTSDMSIMLQESFSVRKWIHQFSVACNAELSFIDKEHEGHHILFYKCMVVDLEIRSIPDDAQGAITSLLADYFKWTGV
jgi:hypothetical protein